MKFSILLPTRNRLDLLRYAIESVLRQDDRDWEIVVSDNASTIDMRNYVRSIGDQRIRCIRQDSLIPVTDNWNAALEASVGEYAIMLGDDDALMPGCLRDLRALLHTWHDPEAIYTQAWQYAYPGVIPNHPQAYVQIGYCEFLSSDVRDPFELPREMGDRMSRAAADFRVRYGFNMQHFVVARRLIDRLRSRGPFFQSPYPDYYAANVVMRAADRIVVNPDALTIIGISPKSFGYYYFNDQEAAGSAFLQNIPSPAMNARLRHRIVPGSNMNDSWLCAMETLNMNYPEFQDATPNYARYRLLQFHALLRSKGWKALPIVLRHAEPRDYLTALSAIPCVLSSLPRSSAERRRMQDEMRAGFSAYPRFDPQRQIVPYQDILEAARHLRS